MKVPGEDSQALKLGKNFIGPETKQACDKRKRLEDIKEEKLLKEKNKKRRRFVNCDYNKIKFLFLYAYIYFFNKH